MGFADITIVPVRKDRKAAYLAFSRRMADIYRDHGAVDVVDYWQQGDPADHDDFHADGVAYRPGVLRAIASVAGAAEGEVVVVTITKWPSRDVRDRGTAAVTKDSRVLATLDEDPIFDGSRLIAESFEIYPTDG